ncbi:MAG TPA: energy transducer TonB [Bacteroidota bacterium]|nr:energy transducer TonB [Bacteroidota bacterium]
MRKSYFSEKDFRPIRLIALLSSLVLHMLIILGLLYYVQRQAEQARQEEMLWGSSGGGGGEGEQDYIIQFGPQSNPEQGKPAQENTTTAQFKLIDIHVYSEHPHALPVVEKIPPKPVAKKQKKRQTIIAENLPTRWIRHGSGPGSGGGAGGGSGGGVGKSTGYSIDWGGTGSRRLLSGRIPRYPEGTDKQMAVILRFTVLPDGSVDAILPARKTDELLESAAIDALRTWRFDPLPEQMQPESQTGRVTFVFKLELSK